MKALVSLINVFGFIALFIAYTMGAPVERPSGVRRALMTYAGQISASCPEIKPVWELGVTVAAAG